MIRLPFVALMVLLLGASILRSALAQNIEELMGKMNLKQKIGQMIQLTTEAIMPTTQATNYDLNKLAALFAEYGIGSLYNTPFMAARSGKYGWTCDEWIKAVEDIQKKVISLGAPPLLIGLDSLHGTNYILGSTIFPHNIGMAATFDPELVELSGMITGKDSRTCGVAWNFGPSADIALQPLWARHYETFGSDPYLSAVLVRSLIRGLQRTDIATADYDYSGNASRLGLEVFQTVTTTKHWAGYSNPNTGADRTDATVPEWMLNRYYIPSFSAAIAEKSSAVMLNSGTMNTIPGHADRERIENTLRGTLGFDGFCLSDYEDVQNLYQKHKVAKSLDEAVRLAFTSGLNMAMAPWDLAIAGSLYRQVQSGAIPQSVVDNSVRKILQAKKDAGLFEKPFGFPRNAATVGSAGDRAAARRAVEEGVTLLKNNNKVLPFSSDSSTKKTVLVTGQWADSLTLQSGGWTWQWQGSLQESTFTGRGTTLLQGIKNRAASLGWNIIARQGVGQGGRLGDYNQAIADAASADYIVVAIGERPYAEMLNNIFDLAHPGVLGDFVDALKRAGNKPVILVLFQGRQRTSTTAFNAADAILYGYLPGPEGGAGIARVLFGDVNPSGRLPFDYIGQTGQRHLQYGTFAHTPLYEFGHGLSYTTFSISNLSTSAIGDEFTLTNPRTQYLEVSVTVTNTGTKKGKEVVLVSMTEFFNDAPAPQALLMTKRFIKLELNPGESRRITFKLNGSDFRYSIPAGGATVPLNITVRIGSDVKSPLSAMIAFSSLLPLSSWPQSLAENMPENLTRPSSFLAPDAAPPVADSPFAPPPIEPPQAAPIATPTTQGEPQSGPPRGAWDVPPFSFGEPTPDRAPEATPITKTGSAGRHNVAENVAVALLIVAALLVCA